jgi:hypothetical protein
MLGCMVWYDVVKFGMVLGSILWCVMWYDMLWFDNGSRHKFFVSSLI